MDEHCDEILPGCAREFGEIKQWQESQGSLLKEVRQAVIGDGNPDKSVIATQTRHSTILKILGAAIVIGFGVGTALMTYFLNKS